MVRSNGWTIQRVGDDQGGGQQGRLLDLTLLYGLITIMKPGVCEECAEQKEVPEM